MTLPAGDVEERKLTAADRMVFAGVAFHRFGRAETLKWLTRRNGTDRFAYVVTPNADHVVRLDDHPNWREMQLAYEEADLCLCDSRVVSLLARLRGVHLPVVPGSELVEQLFREGVAGRRIAVIGGRQGTLERLAALARGAELLQHIPPMGLIDNPQAMERCLAFIEEAHADFTLLCVGSPQQELLAYRASLGGKARGTGLCVGAAIDFLTGDARRAPAWMQLLALEWLYRLLTEPRRLWRRYLLHSSRILLLAWR